MIMNKKGFVLTETLVVTVFLITISTFVYTSILPLMGRYEDMSNRENDIDIVYKLYHIRKMLYDDANRDTIVSTNIKDITCSDFANSSYCTKLFEHLDLIEYKLIYVKDIYTNLNAIDQIDIAMNSTELHSYLKKYQDDMGEYLVLLDRNRHTIAHLLYSPFVQSY